MSADIVGPDKKLSHFIAQFVKELDDDFQSPTISRFQEHMPDCREGLLGMEEVCNWLYSDRRSCDPLQSLSTDKSHVHKLIGSIKELSKCSEGRLNHRPHHPSHTHTHTTPHTHTHTTPHTPPLTHTHTQLTASA